MQQSVDIFLGYATEDRELCFEVKKRLKWLEREGLIRTWHEYAISPGMERERELLRYLAMAHIILLFVSADFIDSDFCYGIELKHAMERHEQGEARVIPIILRSVYWQETPLGKLQALPKGNQPIKSWQDQDVVLTEIERDIREVIKKLVAEKYLQEGHHYLEQNQYERAVESCQQALRWEPRFIAAHRLKGLVLFELKRYDEALVAYDEALRLGPSTASMHKERGDILHYLHRYEDALTSYKDAIALRPDFVVAYTGASKALRELAKENDRLAEIYDEQARKLSQAEENGT